MKIEFVLIASLLCFSGCQSLGPNAAGGGALGGLTGGLAGAAIGATEGKAPEGALIGAVTGATAGTIVGDAVDRDIERQHFVEQHRYNDRIASSITLDGVIRMTQSGLSSDVIARQIATQGVAQRPTIDDLIFLKQQNVDDLVINAMQNAPVAGQTAAVRYVEPAPVIVERYPRFRPRKFGPPPRCAHPCEPGVEFFFGF